VVVLEHESSDYIGLPYLTHLLLQVHDALRVSQFALSLAVLLQRVANLDVLVDFLDSLDRLYDFCWLEEQPEVEETEVNHNQNDD
jgi:hypothetical protein